MRAQIQNIKIFVGFDWDKVQKIFQYIRDLVKDIKDWFDQNPSVLDKQTCKIQDK